jgi:hypothetical protein
MTAYDIVTYVQLLGLVLMLSHSLYAYRQIRRLQEKSIALTEVGRPWELVHLWEGLWLVHRYRHWGFQTVSVFMVVAAVQMWLPADPTLKMIIVAMTVLGCSSLMRTHLLAGRAHRNDDNIRTWVRYATLTD